MTRPAPGACAPIDVWRSGERRSCGLRAHHLAKALRLATRHLDLATAAEIEDESRTGARFDPLDRAEVDELATVRAEEGARVETLFEVVERSPEERRVLCEMETRVVSLRSV